MVVGRYIALNPFLPVICLNKQEYYTKLLQCNTSILKYKLLCWKQLFLSTPGTLILLTACHYFYCMDIKTTQFKTTQFVLSPYTSVPLNELILQNSKGATPRDISVDAVITKSVWNQFIRWHGRADEVVCCWTLIAFTWDIVAQKRTTGNKLCPAVLIKIIIWCLHILIMK